MRKFLASLLALVLLVPFASTVSMAKEDKKAPAKSAQAKTTPKKSEDSKPNDVAAPSSSNASRENNNSATTPSTSASGSSSTSSNGPQNAAGNSGNNPSSASDSAPGNSAASGKPDNSGKPESTGKPEVTGKPENPGAKNLVLAEGEVRNFVVRFRDDASIATEATNLRGQQARVTRTFNNVFKGLSATLNAKQLEALQKNPRVELIEEDIEIRTTQTQSNAPWGLDRIDQRALPLNGTFTYATSGANVRAYVVDTGLRATHSDFTGRVQPGYSAISDGRGTDDCNGHGTHVAGTMAGTTYGVSKFASIIPVRVLACDGSGSLSGVIAGLDWIAANNPSGTPAVVNMSLGGGASSMLDSAVTNLINRGITVVVAAGNSAASACNYSPARVAAAITVAASTLNDQLASYSNHGSCVDIVAPGSSITSAWISSDVSSATLNGTSMAAPHVSGAVVGLFVNGYLSPANVDSQIKALATSGVFSSLPSGTPNTLLFATLETSEEVTPTPAPVLALPSAPSGVVALPLKRAAQLSWQLAADDGGAPITSQLIDIITGGKVVNTVSVGGTITGATVRSLNPRLSYTFTVKAINSVGTGPASAPSAPINPLR